MAVSLKQAWAFLGGVSEVNVQAAIDNECKDEALSVSGDSSAYSEDGNIAKAARIEEPTRREWAALQVTSPATPTHAPIANQGWTPTDASAVYNVHGWSEGYFEVTSDGNLAVKPHGGKGKEGGCHTGTRHPTLKIFSICSCLHQLNPLINHII